ncbi:uncharacterized protein At1g65710-like [Impatiens glandulifera]|uniref:uncharacterized protein At1g65710-like n=1 Tax=Impatiens glandulifera TaxID=253017 RepID=UPI001FB13F84|nr:uncharacterized protein At1g65710-like [Impatiens glandulifera]
MGSCFSKKTRGDNTSPSQTKPPQNELKTLVTEKKTRVEDQETLKKEFLITKPSKSHDLDRFSEDDKGRTEQNPIALSSDNNPTKSDPIDAPGSNIALGLGVLRTSSCTKEEIDAILIQCGRLSRSSSNGKAACSGSSDNQASGHARKYSGSKRSFDFDQDGSNNTKGNSFQRDVDIDVEDGDDDQTTVERIRRHRQRQSSGRRRTPSRERDQQQRSGSSRRVSRSPTGRRSESPNTGGGAILGNITNNNAVNKPGKIISVPATVNSLVLDKRNNLSEATTAIKRIQVNEKPVGSRSAASPRSQSPARANVRAAAENPNPQSGQQQQQPSLSLSRSNSRKAEQSPFRRNPLGEIDQNITTGTGYQKAMVNNGKITDNNPTSYTALLLEDIQKFHQKKPVDDLKKKKKESFVEDDLLEQSSHQYVTVRRKGREEDLEESSGSNSVVSGGHNWVSTDSTDSWSTSSVKDDPIDIRRRGRRMTIEKKGFENNKQTTGIGRKRNVHSIAASS